jgi:hypothetical protein
MGNPIPFGSKADINSDGDTFARLIRCSMRIND